MSLARVGLLPAQQLGRHVGERARDQARSRSPATCGFGQLLQAFGRHAACDPEVEHLRPPVRRDDDVRAFQIAMDDTVAVRVRQRVGNLNSVPHDGFGWQAVARVSQLAESCCPSTYSITM